MTTGRATALQIPKLSVLSAFSAAKTKGITAKNARTAKKEQPQNLSHSTPTCGPRRTFMSASKLMPYWDHDRQVIFSIHSRPEVFTEGTQLISTMSKASRSEGALIPRIDCLTHAGKSLGLTRFLFLFLKLAALRDRWFRVASRIDRSGGPSWCLPDPGNR